MNIYFLQRFANPMISRRQVEEELQVKNVATIFPYDSLCLSNETNISRMKLKQAAKGLISLAKDLLMNIPGGQIVNMDLRIVFTTIMGNRDYIV